jgi:hypothetical protein
VHCEVKTKDQYGRNVAIAYTSVVAAVIIAAGCAASVEGARWDRARAL